MFVFQMNWKCPGLPLFREFAENRIFGPCGKFRKCKFSPWEDSRKSAIPPNRITIAGSRFTGRHLPGMSRLPRFRPRAQLSEIPLSSLSPFPQSALVAELKAPSWNQFMRNSDRRKQSCRLLEWPEICAC